MAEGHVCDQYTTHEWEGGRSGGVLPQKIFESRKCPFLHSEHPNLLQNLC